MRRAALALLLFLAGVSTGAQDAVPAQGNDAELVTRTFEIRYKKVEEVILVIHELVTDRGEVRIQKHLRRITVRDVQSAVDAVAEAIRSYDVPPPTVEVTMTLFLGTRGQPAEPGEAEAVFQSIVEELRGALRYTNYEVLGKMQVSTLEGEAAMATLADGAYRVELRVEQVDPERRLVQLSPLVLSRRREGAAGEASYERLLSTTLSLRDGQQVVQGLAPRPGSDRALFLYLTTRITR